MPKVRKEIPELEKLVQVVRKKFVRYKDGAEIYSMCQSKFERMVREAKATYKLDKLVLVNTEIFERYLETFRVVE